MAAKGNKKEMVNSPNHYNAGSIELMDFIDDWKLGRYAFNIVKYTVRAPFKNGLEDLKKAQWYLNRWIKRIEEGKDTI